MSGAGRPLLSVRGLKKYFPVRGGFFRGTAAMVHAVDDVDFDLAPGSSLGIVGETGCGKSTTGRLVLRLLEATAGTILFDGADLRAAGREEMMRRRREMQIVFQDPYSSLNPRFTAGQAIAEPFRLHERDTRAGREAKVAELLKRVGLEADDMGRYPHEFSGGQRQRIGIARALALKPRLVVLDEPVSSLDVSIQAQIVNLLLDLQEEYGLAYLFISHDLGLVEHFSDTVAVMYLGRIVETGPVGSLYSDPRHPYTEALLASIPAAGPEGRALRHRPPPGDVPSPISPPPGCPFNPRCPLAVDECRRTFPAPDEAGPGHIVRCHVRGKGSRP